MNWASNLAKDMHAFYRDRIRKQQAETGIVRHIPILYGMDHSSGTRAVCMLAEELQIPLDIRQIDDCSTPSYECGSPRTPDRFADMHRVVNPQRLVPKLVDNGHVLYDSHAISVYLINQYGPIDSPLYPCDLVRRAHIDRILHFDSSTLSPLLCKEIHSILHRDNTSISRTGRVRMLHAYTMANAYLAPGGGIGSIAQPPPAMPGPSRLAAAAAAASAAASAAVASMVPTVERIGALNPPAPAPDSSLLAVASPTSPQFVSPSCSSSTLVFADRFMAGSTLTLADITCIATLTQMEVLVAIPQAQMPHLHTWMANVQTKLECFERLNRTALDCFRTVMRVSCNRNMDNRNKRVHTDRQQMEEARRRSLRAKRSPVRMVIRQPSIENIAERPAEEEEAEAEADEVMSVEVP